MESKSLLNARNTISDIRYHFDFLFRRGFEITSALFFDSENEKWQVVLTTGDYLIQLQGYRESISMAFSSTALYSDFGYMQLHDLIGLLEPEGSAPHIPQAPPFDKLHEFTSIARWLKEHIEDVWVLLEKIRLMLFGIE